MNTEAEKIRRSDRGRARRLPLRPAGQLTQISARGQLTLPAGVRRALGLSAGDPLIVTIEDGRIVLSPAVVTPIELYTDERVTEFHAAASMTPEEIEAVIDAAHRFGLV